MAERLHILSLMQKQVKLKEAIFMKVVDYIILILVVVGALNWGLIGFFRFDLIRVLFGDMSLFSRIIYAIVGLCGIYAISYFGRIRNNV